MSLTNSNYRGKNHANEKYIDLPIHVLTESAICHNMLYDMLVYTINGMYFHAAVGCAMPTLPIAMWSQRRGSDITVKCNSTGNTWHLVCKDNEWIGSFGNCSSGKHNADLFVS